MGDDIRTVNFAKIVDLFSSVSVVSFTIKARINKWRRCKHEINPYILKDIFCNHRHKLAFQLLRFGLIYQGFEASQSQEKALVLTLVSEKPYRKRLAK